MFFDWVTVYQDFDFELPIIGEDSYMRVDVATGEASKVVQPGWQHEGSYSTSIRIRISGNRITMSGNPSRYGRIENLFGLSTLDECMAVYNRILVSLGLPEFTKCTQVWNYTDKVTGSAKMRLMTDGAVFQELHVTSNKGVGNGCTDDYLKGLSSVSYRNAIPRLHTNGKTVDWLSKKGNAHLMYPSVYDKANELRLHSLEKIKRLCGPDSDAFHYLNMVIDFCDREGIARFEQKLKGKLLTRENARYWGLFDEQKVLKPIHEEFVRLDDKLQVTAMTLEGIGEKLLRLGIVDTTRAANTTALYAIQWMHGQTFDLNKSQVQMHRARLRKVGLDIARPCNISQTSPVYVKKAKEVVISDVVAPDWYRRAGDKQPTLRLVA